MANPFTPEQISQILEEFFKVVGTRQYIGARYVPIFGRKGEESIEWDNSAPYEPLTIVLYQGNSYTSRQYVPVGMEITNQEFWAITGNYNAQIEQYRKELRDVLPYDETPTEGSTKGVTSDGIEKAITKAVADETTRATDAEETNADAIANEVTRAKGAEKANADAIANEVTRAKEAEQVNATAITAETTRATNKENINANNIVILNETTYSPVMVVIGDSFSVNGYATVTKPWWQYVADSLRCTPKCYARGSAGFTIAGNSFGDQLDTANTSISDKHSVKYVFVYGGINDVNNNATYDSISNAVSAVASKARSYFPYAKVYICGCNTWQTYSDISVKNVSTYYATRAIVDTAGRNGCIGVPTLYSLIWNSSYFLQSGTGAGHPNDAGQRNIGQNILANSGFGGLTNQATQYYTEGNTNDIYKYATITSYGGGSIVLAKFTLHNLSVLNNKSSYLAKLPIQGAFLGELSAISYSGVRFFINPTFTGGYLNFYIQKLDDTSITDGTEIPVLFVGGL